jgi:ornithine cyclodeaminase
VGAPALDILFLSGDDVRAVDLSDPDVLDAVEAAVREQGEEAVTLDPRVHHVPDSGFPGHFNVLRATVWPLGVTGVKVVGDYVANHERGLPSELALLTLYDPRTGVPIAIVDATEITERRTGALTALGARELGRQGSAVLAHLGARGTAFANVTMLDRLFDFGEISGPRTTGRPGCTPRAGFTRSMWP